LLLATLGLTGTAFATGEERYFALIVGYNGRPAGTTDPQVQPLRYADDDALAFFQLQRETGGESVLLTIPDTESRRRYPQAAEVARPPSQSELFQAIDSLNARMDAVKRGGDAPVLVFFYSGHGARTQADGSGEAALTLMDGPLSQTALQQQVLGKARATLVHVIIDACYAEALVRSRDVNAQTVELAPAEMAARLSRTATARFPHVGVAISSHSDAPAHEWDVYQSGVFSHEVISGLRGAADVNADGRVEYSELDAFMTAANREVVDPRARVQGIVQPPSIRAHAALIRIGPAARTGWLAEIPSSVGSFYVEDLRGNRIADGHAERGFAMAVAVPAGEPLFVRTADREAELTVRAGHRQPFAGLDFRPRPLRSRGAVERSLQSGLFVMPYGPAYYSGYVDRQDAVAVVELPRDPVPAAVAAPRTESSARGALEWTLRGAAGALLVSSAAFGALAWDAYGDHQDTSFQRPAMEAEDRYRLDRTLAISFLISGAACAAASYLIGRDR
jgi:hypothetical protein